MNPKIFLDEGDKLFVTQGPDRLALADLLLRHNERNRGCTFGLIFRILDLTDWGVVSAQTEESHWQVNARTSLDVHCWVEGMPLGIDDQGAVQIIILTDKQSRFGELRLQGSYNPRTGRGALVVMEERNSIETVHPKPPA